MCSVFMMCILSFGVCNELNFVEEFSKPKLILTFGIITFSPSPPSVEFLKRNYDIEMGYHVGSYIMW